MLKSKPLLFSAACCALLASGDDSSINITCRPPALSKVQTLLSDGGEGVYQIARFVQLDAETVGFFVNIRKVNSQACDLEIGTDFCFTRDPELRKFEGFQALTRCEIIKPAQFNKNFMMVSYPLFAAFVPLGAKLSDGSPHPHAGTGFAFGVRLGRPCDENGKCAGYAKPLAEDCYDEVEIMQLAWDGKKLLVTGREHQSFYNPAGKFTAAYDPRPPLAGVVSDGEDLLTGLTKRINNERLPRAGVCRWQRHNGKWQIAEFTPIGAPGSFEPSLIRDKDGLLLYTHRTAVKRWTPELKLDPEALADAELSRDIRIWRSRDNGRTWQQCIHKKDCANACPVSIAVTNSGTPVILTNAKADVLGSGEEMFHGGVREKMLLWPLNDARNALLEPLPARDAIAEFGNAPYGRGWYLDHPVSLRIRLSDKKWHCAVAYRNLDISESGGNKTATPFTGLYVEKINTPEADIPAPWKF